MSLPDSHGPAARGATVAQPTVDELRALVAETEGFEPDTEEELRAERERLRHVTELAAAAETATAALTPDEDAGAADLVGTAEQRQRKGEPECLGGSKIDD